MTHEEFAVRIVGMQGTREIYESTYKGVTRRVAITVSDNGFIIGANPKSMPKSKP